MISSVLWLYTVSQSFWHVPPDYILHIVGADGLKPLSSHFPWLASDRDSWQAKEKEAILSAPRLWSVRRHQDGCALMNGDGNDKKCSAVVQGFYADVPDCMLHVFADMVSFLRAALSSRCADVLSRSMANRDLYEETPSVKVHRWPWSRKGQMVWGEYERFMVWHCGRLAWWRPNGVPHHDFPRCGTAWQRRCCGLWWWLPRCYQEHAWGVWGT